MVMMRQMDALVRLAAEHPYSLIPFEQIYCSHCNECWDGRPHRCAEETVTIVWPTCRGCQKPQFADGFKDGGLCIRCLRVRTGR